MLFFFPTIYSFSLSLVGFNMFSILRRQSESFCSIDLTFCKYLHFHMLATEARGEKRIGCVVFENAAQPPAFAVA